MFAFVRAADLIFILRAGLVLALPSVRAHGRTAGTSQRDTADDMAIRPGFSDKSSQWGEPMSSLRQIAHERRISGTRHGALPERPSASRVLIAHRDPTWAGVAARELHSVGLVPTLAFTSGQAISCLTTQRYELFLLDMSLEEGGARELVSVARRVCVPVITVASDVADGDMDWVAEDHLDVDASQGEVVGRCLAVVRISRPVGLPARLSWGPLELDPRTREGFWKGHPLGLTSIQYRLLEVLALATGSVVTVPELARHIWGDDSFDDGERIVAHVRRIRKKIETDPSRATFLLTVRGQGFRLADSEVREPHIDLTEFEQNPIR